MLQSRNLKSAKKSAKMACRNKIRKIIALRARSHGKIGNGQAVAFFVYRGVLVFVRRFIV